MNFQTDIFEQYDKKWALLTAGNKEKFNTMTISWGGLGTLWGKPVANVYVRTTRYTHEFIDNSDYFTISFFSDEYKKTLAVLGSKSGRDMDKMKDSGLVPKQLEHSMTFEEAEVTLVCKKLFKQTLDVKNMPEDIRTQYYENQPDHDMYIGEVLEII